MTDDDNTFDHDEFDHSAELPERASLRETWESNPLLKIAAVVLVIAIAAGAYMTFFGGKTESKDHSVVSVGDISKATVTPGAKEADPEYSKAVKEQNANVAEKALSTGMSAMPTPINTAKSGGIDLPATPVNGQDDPLKEWRARTEAAAQAAKSEAVPPPEDMAQQQPDVAPMVQPIRPAQVVKIDPNEVKAIAGQMRVIISAQAPQASAEKGITTVPSAYEKMLDAQKAAEAALQSQQNQAGTAGAAGTAVAGAGAAGTAPGQQPADEKVIVPSGAIAYVQLLTALDSDVKGPALAAILSGPFAGGRALGEFTLENEYLVITFKRVIKDGVSYKLNGIALDEKTTLAGNQTSVDHHYFTRVILPAAAKFVEGYGSAVAQTGTTTTTTSGGGVASNTPKPNATEQVYAGVQEGAKQLSQILTQDASNTTVTVKVAKGTTMGLLFMDPVTTGDANK